MHDKIDRQQLFEARREQESQFTDENWMVRVNNELHSRFLPLNNSEEQRPRQHLELLEEAFRYYDEIGDEFNIFRLHLKMGHLEEAEHVGQNILKKTDEPNFFSHYASDPAAMDAADILELKKAYVLGDLAKYKNNSSLKEQAATRFIDYAESQSQRDELSGYEAAALAFWQARNLVVREKRDGITAECIVQFRKVVADRAEVGDRWWESIALRQIGKISPDSSDRVKALERSEELVEEYQEIGDYKKAALWARDVNDINPSPENSARMEGLWIENISRMEVAGNTREVAKSFWSLFKRVIKSDRQKAEDYRLKAIEWYERVLDEEKAKDHPDPGRVRECYWAFSDLIR
ncbi:MAG: hypothetical protein JW816_00255 [Candidatus Buchananbacteria bacterium]|nr:hypothetical protein [Candidatus Buchananbacteria bacterium]